MTTNNHTDISVGAPANASVINAPLGQLDQAITDIAIPVTLLGTGVDESATINAGITTAVAQGGGRVVLLGGKTASFSSSILMKNNVVLDLNGSTLKWIGAVGGSLITSGTTDPLMRAGLIGGIIDPQTTATGFGVDWHSPQFCKVDIEFLSGSATFTVGRWASDATNASGYQATRNAVWNYVPRWLAGICGTGLRFTGQASGAITLNRFDMLNMGPCRVVGLVGSSTGYNDTNSVGQARFQLGANNAIGVDLGENNASTNMYNWAFQNLATDDPTNTFTGLVGIAMRNSAKTTIGNFYPQFTGGTPILPGIATSWLVRDTYGLGGGSILQRSVGLVSTGSHVLQLPAYVTPYTPNLDLGDFIAMTLTGPITVNLPAAPMALTYPEFTFAWIQDAGAGRVVTYNGSYKIGTSAPAMVTTANVMTMDRFMWDGSLYRLVSRMTGY